MIDPKTKPPSGSVLYKDYAAEQVVNILTKITDPDMVLTKLGLSRYELKKLETDDEISAALETRREAVLATPWRLDPFDNDKVEWLWNELELNIEKIMRSAWSAIPYGYSIFEVVYNKGEYIGLGSIQEKPIEWFEPKRSGEIIYTPPDGSTAHTIDTTYKFFCTRRQATYRNPYGEALLSRVYWPWFFKYNGMRTWARFLERFADPLLIGTVNDPVAFVAAMKGLGFESLAAVSPGENIAAVTNSGSMEFSRLESTCSKNIQKLILGQTLTSDTTGAGSYAMAEVHNFVRDDKRRSDVKLVSNTMQAVINALWSLNSFTEPVPKFIMQDDKEVDATRATRDAALANAGILKFTEQYLLNKYDLEPGDFTIPSEAPSAQPTAKLSMSPKIDPYKLRNAIELSATHEDLYESVANLYQGNSAAEFNDILSKSMFAMEIIRCN